MIKVIVNGEELRDFEEVWHGLYAEVPCVTPFQKFEYIRASISFMGTDKYRLHIICIKDDSTNRWVAIFPLCLGRNGILYYINYHHSDFCLPLIHPDFDHYNLYKELSEYFQSNNVIRGIRWDNLLSNSQLLSVLKSHFRYSIVHDINYYSSIPIYATSSDKDFIDAFRYVAAKQRRTLRKTLSKIETDCEFTILSAQNGDSYPERQISEIVHKMVDDGIRAEEYFSERMLFFWKQLFEDGVLSIAMISRVGEVESCNFMYYDKKNNEYIKWIMLYVESSWNMKINIMIARYIYENGGAAINFARGIYDYKLVNFHPDVKPLFRVMIAKTKWGHFKNIISTAFHYSKPIVKSWLGR